MAGNLDIGMLTGRIRFTANTRDANANMQKLGKTIRQQEAAQKRLVSALNRADQKRQDTIRSIKKSTMSHQEQNDEIRKVNAAYQTMRNQAEGLAKGNLRGTKAQNTFNNAVNETKRNLKDHAEATKKAEREASTLDSTLSRMRKNLDKLLGKFRVWAFVLGATGAAIVAVASELEALGAIAAGVLVDIQFDLARQRLNSFKDSVQATRQQLDRFTDIANNAGVRVTAVVEGMADFSTAARSAGLNLAQTNEIIRGFSQSQSDAGGSSEEVNKKMEDLAGLAKQATLTMGDLEEAVAFTNNPLETLANAFGTNVRQIRTMIEQGDELRTSVLVPLSQQLKEQSEASDGLAASFNRLLNEVTKLFRQFNAAGVIDSITGQLRNLKEFLQTPAGAEFITGLSDAANKMINETIPNFVKSVRNNWETIKSVTKGLFGFLIGAAAGGSVGGVIGAFIGAMGLGSETMAIFTGAIKTATDVLGPFGQALLLISTVGFKSVIIGMGGAIAKFASSAIRGGRAAGILAGGLGAIRTVLGFLTGPAGLIISAVTAIGLLSLNSDDAATKTDKLAKKLSDAADQAERMANASGQTLINEATKAIQEQEKAIDRLISKREEIKRSIPEGFLESETRTAPGEIRLKQINEEIAKRREKTKGMKEDLKVIKQQQQAYKELNKSGSETIKTNVDISNSLEDFRTSGDPFADQVKSIESFTDRIDDLKQSIADIRTRLAGGDVPEKLREFTNELEGLNRQNMKDAAASVGIEVTGMSPQALGTRDQLLKSITERVKEWLNTRKQLQVQEFLQEENKRIERQIAAYKAGEKAIERYDARKKIAAKTGKTFSEVTSKEVDELVKLNDKLEQSKDRYERFQQAKEQLGDAVGDSLTDAVVSANSLSEALNDLGKQIARIIMQKGVSEPLANAVSGAIGGMFGNNTTTSTSGVGNNVPVVKGNAKGGIVNRTSAMMTTSGVQTMSENNKSEAILPLERQNGMLGVRSTGGESSAPIINIYNEGGGEAEVEESTDASGRSVIDIIIPAVQSGIQQGKLDGAMTKRFQGLQPRVKGR